tara:strand:+ start:872 stop:1057 length:186 start_codon:yes stop_codon:yes gene_type:complete
MKFELEMDELSFEDGLVHMMVGDMFDVTVSLEDGYLVAEGRSRDVWAWMAFHLMSWCGGDE